MWARIKAYFKRLFTWSKTEADIVASDFRTWKAHSAPGVDEEASKPI